jgi:PAS domain-containing protein
VDAANGAELALVVDRAGRYVGGDAELLDALGYELDELRGLSIGALSGFEQEGRSLVWERYVRGEFEFRGNRPIQLRHKDGALVAATLVRVEPLADGTTWTIKMRLGLPRPTDWPSALDAIIGQWRALERLRDSLDPLDAARPELDERIARLREAYHSETRRRQAEGGEDGDGD